MKRNLILFTIILLVTLLGLTYLRSRNSQVDQSQQVGQYQMAIDAQSHLIIEQKAEIAKRDSTIAQLQRQLNECKSR